MLIIIFRQAVYLLKLEQVVSHFVITQYIKLKNVIKKTEQPCKTRRIFEIFILKHALTKSIKTYINTHKVLVVCKFFCFSTYFP